jgi:hypothetical protein
MGVQSEDLIVPRILPENAVVNLSMAEGIDLGGKGSQAPQL